MYERLKPDERLRVLQENQDYMDQQSPDNKENVYPFVAMLFGKDANDEIDSIYVSVIGRRPHTKAIYVFDDNYYDADHSLNNKYAPNFSFWIWYKNKSDLTDKDGKEYLSLFLQEMIRDRRVVVYDQKKEFMTIRNLILDKLGIEYGGDLVEMREYTKKSLSDLPDWQLETLMKYCELPETYENNMLGKLMAIQDVWISIKNKEFFARNEELK